MKSVKSTVLLLLLVLIFVYGNVGTCVAQMTQKEITEGNYIDVKANYGAYGDGVHDDTNAIQNAADQLSQYDAALIWSTCPGGADSVREVAYPKLIFQPGTYLISRPIMFWSSSALQTDYNNFGWTPGAVIYADIESTTGNPGDVTIKQGTAGTDIFYFQVGAHVDIANMSFSGGQKALTFYTENMNATIINIDNCVFSNTGGYAIQCTAENDTAITQDYAPGIERICFGQSGCSPEGEQVRYAHAEQSKHCECGV